MATKIVRKLMEEGDELNRLIALCISNKSIAEGIVSDEEDMTKDILLEILRQSTGNIL
jgi:hypothetical protein